MSYKDVKNSLKQSAANSRRYSKSDYISLAHAAMNEPDLTATYYSNPSGDTPVSVEGKPVENYRNALKDVVKQFGVDNGELGKLDNMPFTKKHAEAVTELGQFIQDEYVDTGKKLRLPQFCANGTTVTLSREVLDEKTEATKKNVTVDGKTMQVPTGKTIRTEQRSVVKATNKVPAWLKHEV